MNISHCSTPSPHSITCGTHRLRAGNLPIKTVPIYNTRLSVLGTSAELPSTDLSELTFSYMNKMIAKWALM